MGKIISEEIGRYDPYTDKFIKDTTTNRIEVGTDGNPYRLFVSNDNGYLPKDKLYTKADLAAMLTELQSEIEELKNEPACCQHFERGIRFSSDVVQKKIDELKGSSTKTKLTKSKQQVTIMNDQDVLHRSIEYCNNHYDEQSRCDKCPLKGNVCIDRYGNISFNYGQRRMSFMQFTEQFRKMVNILE